MGPAADAGAAAMTAAAAADAADVTNPYRIERKPYTERLILQGISLSLLPAQTYTVSNLAQELPGCLASLHNSDEIIPTD